MKPGELFAPESSGDDDRLTPLAERMRPRTFDELVGQASVLAPGRPLREAIARDALQSIILWGLEAGEDPMYIARRLVRFASEDVGTADPRALSLAVAAKDAVHFIGMPEGDTALAQAVIYLSVAPKSNAVYVAYRQAARDAHTDIADPVPLHLRNAPTRLMKHLDYGKGYEYAHDHADGTTAMECLPSRLQQRQYYKPTGRGVEKSIAERVAAWRAARNRQRPRSDS